MNAGFSTLADLKAALLPEAMRARTTFNAALQTMGLGVAALMQTQCNRHFARMVDATYLTGADCVSLTVDRPPVEAVSLLEIKRMGSTSWEDVSSSIANVYPESGIILLARILGDHRAQLRATFTGGYWWQTWETGDAGSLVAMPNGATPLPADLLSAWHLQCQAVIERTDLINAGAARAIDDKAKQVILPELELIPQVKLTLHNYLRHV